MLLLCLLGFVKLLSVVSDLRVDHFLDPGLQLSVFLAEEVNGQGLISFSLQLKQLVRSSGFELAELDDVDADDLHFVDKFLNGVTKQQRVLRLVSIVNLLLSIWFQLVLVRLLPTLFLQSVSNIAQVHG